jgi:molybdate transport system ATP-binding protein
MLHADLQINLHEFRTDICINSKAEIVVLFGPSGGGKSITLQAIAGLVEPHTGQITLNGNTLFDSSAGINLPPQQRHVGYVPQDYALFPHRTVAENIAYGLQRLPRFEIRQRVDDQLELMNLRSEAGRRPSEISGGQRQRTALARALATQPSLLLMDEPFAAVEEPLRDVLGKELMRSHRQFEIPVILVTHDLAQAFTLADQLVVIEEGISVQAGPSESVYRSPSRPSVARLLGMTNIVSATIVSSRDGKAICRIMGIEQLVTANAILQAGDEVMLGVYPEAIILSGEAENIAGSTLLEGKVREIRGLGLDHNISMQVGTEQLQIRLSHKEFTALSPDLGDQLFARILPEDIHIFADPTG